MYRGIASFSGANTTLSSNNSSLTSSSSGAAVPALAPEFNAKKPGSKAARLKFLFHIILLGDA